MGSRVRWPSLDEVIQYRRQVRALIIDVIDRCELQLPITFDSPVVVPQYLYFHCRRRFNGINHTTARDVLSILWNSCFNIKFVTLNKSVMVLLNIGVRSNSRTSALVIGYLKRGHHISLLTLCFIYIYSYSRRLSHSVQLTVCVIQIGYFDTNCFAVLWSASALCTAFRCVSPIITRVMCGTLGWKTFNGALYFSGPCSWEWNTIGFTWKHRAFLYDSCQFIVSRNRQLGTTRHYKVVQFSQAFLILCAISSAHGITQ